MKLAHQEGVQDLTLTRELMKEYVKFPVYVCTLEGGGS